MQLGWIDFSKNDRQKALNVLDTLKDKDILDELGISPIRDGFADMFFPGTSTVHRGAKYYFLVAYACKDVERGGYTVASQAAEALDNAERETAKRLKRIYSGEGVIGGTAISSGWIKQTPADIYWSSLRRLGFIRGRYSVSQYLKAICNHNAAASDIKRLGNRNDNGDSDDTDAGSLQGLHILDCSTYECDWKNNLSLKLTPAEARALRSHILDNAKGSLLAYLLQNNVREIRMTDDYTFKSILPYVHDERLLDHCKIAVKFSDFLYVLRVLYNHVLSNGKNEYACAELERLKPELTARADIDLQYLYALLEQNGAHISANLKRFLNDSRISMQDEDIDILKDCVVKRERSIKRERAKTFRIGQYPPDDWYGGYELNYRFKQGKRVLTDIFDGEDSVNA